MNMKEIYGFAIYHNICRIIVKSEKVKKHILYILQIWLYELVHVVYRSAIYQQLTGEERRIPFIFDDFRFCRSRVIGLDMTENRIFTLCRMIT
jgi:hypothetical protein